MLLRYLLTSTRQSAAPRSVLDECVTAANWSGLSRNVGHRGVIAGWKIHEPTVPRLASWSRLVPMPSGCGSEEKGITI